MRKNFSIAKYFIVGPENAIALPVRELLEIVVEEGFTCIQIRSKTVDAKEQIELCRTAAEIIARADKENEIALLVNDRLDVALAARELGIKVDGVHVGQTDIPPAVCRKYLGDSAVIGLSAPTSDLLDYVRTARLSDVDYLGAGPLHPSVSKADCGRDEYGKIITRNLDELTELSRISSLPVVVGGGVTKDDLAALKKTNCNGFFVISAIASASDPKRAAHELSTTWDSAPIN